MGPSGGGESVDTVLWGGWRDSEREALWRLLALGVWGGVGYGGGYAWHDGMLWWCVSLSGRGKLVDAVLWGVEGL